MGFGRDENRLSVYDLLIGQTSAASATTSTEVPLLSLIPGSKNLIGANIELVSQNAASTASARPSSPSAPNIPSSCSTARPPSTSSP